MRVEERQTYEWGSFGYTHKLRCIGIAPWGYVERNNILLRKDNIFEGVSVLWLGGVRRVWKKGRRTNGDVLAIRIN